jgi:Zn-finger nucleic acid-binding protein
VAKIKLEKLDLTEIEINICEKCAGKIDDSLFYIMVCRNCGAVIGMENGEQEKMPIKIQDECFRCTESSRASEIFPMI